MDINEYVKSLNLPLLIPTKKAGELIGLKPGTTKNLIYQNKFPLEIRRSGRAFFVRIDDLINYLDKLFERNQEQKPNMPQKRGPGAPRKTEA